MKCGFMLETTEKQWYYFQIKLNGTVVNHSTLSTEGHLTFLYKEGNMESDFNLIFNKLKMN